MTWFAAAEGVDPEAFDTETEADAHIAQWRAMGRHVVVWEINEGDQ